MAAEHLVLSPSPFLSFTVLCTGHLSAEQTMSEVITVYLDIEFNEIILGAFLCGEFAFHKCGVYIPYSAYVIGLYLLVFVQALCMSHSPQAMLY